ncbi:TIGR01621 family pseudouridine synthase [Colwellia sp. 1_MG-2023]|uniref:TIGR01621 family pseudouridine synthase n=1 Tax=Colwellia sp. 1_MG-2023 TaxID=3062649 RepID=UPI0026E44E37|nr:TIGR01621 family pseudouridine synthase [Colwellia sp. 1_MG-2023]MDO6444537.1 TIGR01621 family pseudouridine synthase [Colwellia sp. 1_MG-2023]
MTDKIENELEIVDEQADFIIVNKPSGVGFHDDENQQGFFNQIKTALSPDDLYPVHRLDKMTSGLIIFAKNKNAAIQFQQLFENRHIDKYYLAISDKKPRKKQGLIKGDMEKSRRGTWKLLRSQNNPAISQFFSYGLNRGNRLFIVKPYTGKTHQIRVALNSLGSPIIGDPNYYASSISDRGYLHAYALKFTLNEKEYQYVLPPKVGKEYLEENINNVLKQLTAPWSLAWPKINA